MSNPPLWGSSLLNKLDLPTDIFPDKSWARAPLASSPDEQKARLAQPSQGQVTVPNGLCHDAINRDTSRDGSIAQAFLHLNTRFLHGRPESRLWSPSERYTLLSRLPSAGAIMLARIRQADGSVTRPLLLITGALTTFPAREILQSPTYDCALPIPTSDSEPPPTTPSADWPDAIPPVVFSAASASRNGYFSPTAQRQDLIRDANLLVIPDARPSLAYVGMEVRDGHPNGAHEKANLWAPFVLADDSAPTEWRSWRPNDTIKQLWFSGPSPAPGTQGRRTADLGFS